MRTLAIRTLAIRTVAMTALGCTVGMGLVCAASRPALADPAAQSAPTTIQGDKGESLSTKLNKSDGVIAPKGDIDPGIHAKAPDPHPNSTPVVPPAATGGGTAK